MKALGLAILVGLLIFALLFLPIQLFGVWGAILDGVLIGCVVAALVWELRHERLT